MSISTICVLGGTGFVGRHVCAALAARGLRVRVPTRSPERAKHLTTLPTIELVAADVHDAATLKELFQGCDAVINLVGVLHGGRGRASFASAHTELARKVVNACRQSGAGGVRRVLHMSALNAAENGPSEYLRSKGEAEAIMRASGLDVTIFRPSAVFGPKDKFLNTFATLLKCFPVMIVPAARARFQPVYVGDVAQAFAAALPSQDSIGKSYDLCGPRVYTLQELVQFVAQSTGHNRMIFGADNALTNVMAFAMECVPGKMMSVDNVRSMTVDSVCGDCVFPLGITPQSVEALAPAWLAYRTPRGRYAHFRDRT
jgi:NADH dehydrogenase